MNFGEVKISFQEDKLLSLINKKNIGEVIEYINSYFLKLSTSKSSIMWIPGENLFELIDDTTLKSRYIQNLQIPIYNNQGKQIDVWSLQQWYFSLENSSYRPSIKINRPRLFSGNDKTKYFNMMSKSFFGDNPKKKLSDFPKKVQEGVKLIWDHIYIVWCSRKKNQFGYTQKWLSHVVNGRKMKTALYMYTVEGVGKGIIIEFLRDKVLGKGLVYPWTEKFAEKFAEKNLF